MTMAAQTSRKAHPAQRAKDLEHAGPAEERPSVFDIFLDPALMADPYPLYRRLLAEYPVQADEGLPVVLTRYADVAVALEHRGLSSDDRHDNIQKTMAASGALRPELASMLDRRSFLHRDPPDHTRLRRLAGSALSPRRIEHLRPVVQRLTDGLIDAVAERGTMELINDLAYPLPIATVSRILGLSLEGQRDLPWWRSQMSADFEAPAVAGDECAGYSRTVQEEMIAYFQEIITAKRRNPGDDIVSDLIAAEDKGEASGDEINDTCRLLVVAAHETTTSLIANGMLALLRNPAQLRAMQESDAPAAAVEEILRYDAPIQFTRRIAVDDIEINGIPVSRGRMVLLWIAAANRDPVRFAEPDRLDLRRPDNHHLGFGGGIHACLGAGLARLQARVALGTLCRRLVDPELAADPPTYLPHAVHALETLPITFREARPSREASHARRQYQAGADEIRHAGSSPATRRT
jgi:cytochrome P450